MTFLSKFGIAKKVKSIRGSPNPKNFYLKGRRRGLSIVGSLFVWQPNDPSSSTTLNEEQIIMKAIEAKY